MRPIPAAGLSIGVLCSLWLFMMISTGWYTDPAKLNLFVIVYIVLLGGLIWGLRRTAAEGRPYSGQVVAGTQMSVIAGAVLFVASFVLTGFLFPDYFDRVNEFAREVMAGEGKSEEEIQQVLTDAAPSLTPVRNALAVAVGTVVRGIAATALISVWVRAERKPVEGGRP
jgi:hypothetical protein